MIGFHGWKSKALSVTEEKKEEKLASEVDCYIANRQKKIKDFCSKRLEDKAHSPQPAWTK